VPRQLIVRPSQDPYDPRRPQFSALPSCSRRHYLPGYESTLPGRSSRMGNWTGEARGHFIHVGEWYRTSYGSVRTMLYPGKTGWGSEK
jgi:hypothetical protein